MSYGVAGDKTGKRIVAVKEAVYGFTTYYVVKYSNGTTDVRHHCTSEMEKFLTSND